MPAPGIDSLLAAALMPPSGSSDPLPILQGLAALQAMSAAANPNYVTPLTYNTLGILPAQQLSGRPLFEGRNSG